jgi:circadian clock protein KaiC
VVAKSRRHLIFEIDHEALGKSQTMSSVHPQLAKALTGIRGLDQITGGGLPLGRTSLVCGAAGCGKTLMAMEFLVRGATLHGEPGVFIAFEESAAELAANVQSLGFDLPRLIDEKLLSIDEIKVERSEIEETGEYNLDGLFVRLGQAIDAIGAKRVVLDTLESLFASFANEAILRAELRRLFGWLKDRGVTAIITAERGEGQLTRQGLEEYVSDCVILLDHRISEQLSTRRLRIVKYRGSAHGANEYPFLIDEHGISVLPLSALRLEHTTSEERVSSGIPAIDEMLGGGLYRGTSVLVSGTPGSGKSSIAASFADGVCRTGERCLYLAFEESAPQIIRNMRSIGLDLQRWMDAGLLQIHASRPTALGLEAHLVTMHRLVEAFQPTAVVIDPMTNMLSIGLQSEAHAMLMRIVDELKGRGITALLTSLTGSGDALEKTLEGISSLIDTWFLVRDVDAVGERNRLIHIMKSRGMSHSNQVREFLITDHGVHLREVYLGPSGVLTGSARVAQEARDREAEAQRLIDAAEHEARLRHRERQIASQIDSLRAEQDAVAIELDRVVGSEAERLGRATAGRQALAGSRRASSETISRNGGAAHD